MDGPIIMKYSSLSVVTFLKSTLYVINIVISAFFSLVFVFFLFFLFFLLTCVFICTMSLLSVQFSSVAQLCPTLCDPMDCSMPAFPVHHQLPDLDQNHVHPSGDAIQPSCPLSPPSPPAFNLSLHQGLFNEPSLHIR